jgi:multidrug efflux system outer membrane protein
MRSPALLVACLALAACNSAPPYRQPDLPVADRFASDESAGGNQLATEIGWQNFFGDPQLRYLIALALANNRDFAASVARVEQARALYRIQDAQRLPQVNASAGASRNQAPLASFDPVLAGTDASVTYNQYNVQAALTAFELDFWGRVSNLSEAALRRYLATAEADRAFRLSLIANVAATYYAMRAGQ